MLGISHRFAAAAAFSLLVTGCASAPDFDSVGPPESGAAEADLPSPYRDYAHVETPSTPMQCVPYARARSGLDIHGDAATWWAKADGLYDRSSTPRLGAVIVLTGYAGPGRGHVGVVSRLDSDREIRIDHANWLDDGAIYLDDPVFDVSADNDWSEVRVWNLRARAWGARTYHVRGFIGPAPGAFERVAAE